MEKKLEYLQNLNIMLEAKKSLLSQIVFYGSADTTQN